MNTGTLLDDSSIGMTIENSTEMFHHTISYQF